MAGDPQTPGGRRSWGEIIDAWRAEFPGRFDQYDDYELAQAIDAEVPQFRGMADPLSLDALLTRQRGGAAPLVPGGGWAPTPGQRSEAVPAGKEAPIDMGTRAPTWGDTIVEVGLATVPALAGGAIGMGAGPAGAAAGAAAGGSLGEFLREAYQSWAGLREDGISWTNVAVQGGINALPIGGAAARVARAAAPKLAAATPAIVGRIGQNVVEGAVGGTTSTGAERVIRDQEVPGLGELATSAGIGAGFGAAFGAGMEGWTAGRRVLANRQVPTGDIGGLLDQLTTAAPEAKSAIAQQIYERAEQLRLAGDPAGGTEILRQLMAAGAQVEQQALQGIASDFLRTYAQQVDTLTTPQRQEITQAFLSELRARNLNEQAYRTLTESLATLQAGTPPPLFGPVEGPATRAAQPIPGAENFGRSELGDFDTLEAQMAAGLEAPQDLRPRLLQGPDAAPLLPEDVQVQAAFREAEAQAAAHPYYGRQAALGLEGQVPLTPVGSAPAPGTGVAGSPPPLPVGVDIYPAVVRGQVGREDALFMNWLVRDLREFQFQQGNARVARADEDFVAGDADIQFTPHVAGSPVQRAFEVMGFNLTRRALANQIDNFLTGKARKPGQAATAAVWVARALREAYDPQTRAIDWQRVTPETFAGMQAASKNPDRPIRWPQLTRTAPWSPIEMAVEGVRQPDDLLARYVPEYKPATPEMDAQGAPAFDAVDLPEASAPLREVDQLVQSLDDNDLQMLYRELVETAQPHAGDVMDPDGEGFGGAWYEVGPGVLAREIERRGLGRYAQPSLLTEGPGTPGRMPLLEGKGEEPPLPGTAEQRARAIQLYRERGGDGSVPRMAQALKDAGVKLPAKTAAEKQTANQVVRRMLVEADAPAGPTEGPFATRGEASPTLEGAPEGEVPRAFTEADVQIGQVRRGRNFAEAQIDAPATIADRDNWTQVAHPERLRARVAARLADGKAPKKADPVWGVETRDGEWIARDLSFAEAVQRARVWVASALEEASPTLEGAPEAEDLVTLYRVDPAPTDQAPLPDWIRAAQTTSGARDAQGRWWTDDPSTLDFYRQDAGEGAVTRTIQVPRQVAEQFRVRNQPREVQRFSRDFDTEFFLPQEVIDAAAQPAPTLDVLPTGEAQPRLPGDVGAVRDVEQPTPTLMSEADLFSLTSEVAPAPKPRLLRLFGDETGAVGRLDPQEAEIPGAAPARERPTAPSKSVGVRDFTLSREGFQELEQAVAAAGNQEVAGLLLGDARGQIHQIIPTANVAADPVGQFAISPVVIARAQKLAAARGWSLLGSFHSQPTGSAEPSKLDLEGDVRDLPMLILGAQGGKLVDMRVWQPSLGPRGGKGKGAAPWLEGTFQVREALEGTGRPAMGVDTVRAAVEAIPTYRGAPGDAAGLRAYLDAHETQLGGLPWAARARQYLAERNPRMAWVELQAGQVATAQAAREGINLGAAEGLFSPELADAFHAAVAGKIAGGAQDPVGALFALYDGRMTWVDGVGQLIVAPEVPAGLAAKGLRVGPGGILDPGQPGVRLPDEQSLVTMTIAEVNSALEGVNARTILDDPTKESATRLNRQVAERMLLSPAATKATRAWEAQLRAQGMSAREAQRTVQQARAAHFRRTASHAGKILAALSVWKRRHGTEIRKIEGIRGAAGDVQDLLIYGAGGRQLGRLGDLVEADTAKALIQSGRSWDQVMLLHDLTRQEVGAFAAYESASRGLMLSQWATAARNFHSATGRWGLDLYTHTVQGVAQALRGRPGRAINHWKRVVDMATLTPVLRPDGWVMPWHARQTEWEHVLGVVMARGGDRGNALKLLGSVDGEMAHFLGSANFGEPSPHFQSKYRFLNWLASPKVQNTLTMFNRAQEFTVRSAHFTAELKYLLREAGLNPHQVLKLAPADVTKLVGGEEALQRMLHRAAAASLDFTFAGHLVKKGLGKDMRGRNIPAFNTLVIDLINRLPLVRAGYPFPKFNFSAAPRFLWDYGPGGMLEAANYGLLKASKGELGIARGRLYLGKKALQLEESVIPEIDRKIFDAEADLGAALERVHVLSRERGTVKRLISRLERRQGGPGGRGDAPTLEGIQSRALSYRQRLDQIEQALARESDTAEALQGRVKDLEAQRTTFKDIVTQADEVVASRSVADTLGKSFAGMTSLMGLAVLLRADQEGKGTKWYQLRLGQTAEDPEGWMLDTRPLAPFTQVLFLADVLLDVHNNTDWDGVWTDVEAGVDVDRAFMGRYEGKYTPKSWGSEALNAFLSISQAAGTTLALIEQFTDVGQQGFSPRGFVETFIKSMGGFLARATLPLSQFKAASDLFADEESYARIAEGTMGWAAPMLQPVGNIPFLGAATIPETYNQLSGKPLDTWQPQLRALGGISLQKWERMAGEVAETGVPGQTAYLRSTGDYELDRALAFHYSYAISTFGDSLVWQNPMYQELDTPATRRDFLQRWAFPAFKKYAIGQMMAQYGPEEVLAAREGGEARRRRLRVQRLQQLALEEGVRFEEGGEEEEAAPADVVEMEEPQANAAPGFAPEFAPEFAPRSPAAPRFEDVTG